MPKYEKIAVKHYPCHISGTLKAIHADHFLHCSLIEGRFQLKENQKKGTLRTFVFKVSIDSSIFPGVNFESFLDWPVILDDRSDLQLYLCGTVLGVAANGTMTANIQRFLISPKQTSFLMINSRPLKQ